MQRLWRSVDLDVFPQGVDVVQHFGIEIFVGILVILGGKVVNGGVEDIHGFLAHIGDIVRVGVDQGIGAGVVGILRIGDGRLLGEHVVDKDLRQLLVLAAGGDAHSIDVIIGGGGVIEPEIDPLVLGIQHGEIVPCVVGTDGGLAGFHEVIDFVHHQTVAQGLLVQ